MSTPLTSMVARGGWVLGLVVSLALLVPIGVGTLYLFTSDSGTHAHATEDLYNTMLACMFGVTVLSMLNLWIHIRSKRAGKSTRWQARGFAMMFAVAIGGVLWLRALHLGIYDDSSEHGAFFGWFSFSLIFVGMAALNVALFWRRTHRHTHRSRGSRGTSRTYEAAVESPAQGLRRRRRRA